MKRPLRFIALAATAIALSTPAHAQVYRMFSDSPDTTQWAASWGFASGGSSLALVETSHVPVTRTAFLGSNAAGLSWIAASGGAWELTIADSAWVAFDSTPYDTLVFAAWSPGAIGAPDLPLFFLEDANNHRTPTHPLSEFVTGVPASAWTRVAVPLAAFRGNPGGADLTKLNKVFFAQAPTMVPGVPHLLLVDEIRCVVGGLAAPVTPVAQARAYELHAELRWDSAPLAGALCVRVERASGANWVRVADAPAADGTCPDWLGATGVTGSYRASAIGPDLRVSASCPTVSATTRALSDPEWLDMAEEAAFRYFWMHAHPVSGMARERYGSGSTCTTGGTGMGLEAILCAAERGWITRLEASERVRLVADFYDTRARTFHGAYSHWMDGATGAAIPMDAPDDSSMDIVETSYLMQGLLAARQYFDGANASETTLREVATRLWERMDWNAFRPASPGNALDWLWSPKYGFAHSFALSGWNEAMIGYVLAVASPTHPIPASCYTTGWSRNGAMVNGRSFYGYRLAVGPDYGGGLYLDQYSFMTLDPRGRRDAYANYEVQCRNASLIDRAYCAANPGGFAGYSSDIWGLTASDDPFGYSARGPYSGDNGTIAPTAALGMMPFTYQNSLAALKAMYRTYGDRLWGPFGLRDAFNPGQNWFASSYISIDQGPIAVMIENARTQLVWNAFMKNPEIAPALAAMGFVPDSTTVSGVEDAAGARGRLALAADPNPFRATTSLKYTLPAATRVVVTVHDVQGRLLATLWSGRQSAGGHVASWDGRDLQGVAAPAGVYLCQVRTAADTATTRVLLVR
jgi:hypothetical protein